jgi:hypothetical protein
MPKKQKNVAKGILEGAGRPTVTQVLVVMLGLGVLIVALGFLLELALGSESGGYLLDSRLPQITIIKDGRTIECGFADGEVSSDCYKHDRYKIRVDKITSGGVSRECLFIHPRNNVKINIIYGDVLFSNTLNFITAISEESIGREKSPVYMDVYIKEDFKKRVIQLDKKGWLTTDVDTRGYYNEVGDVKLVIYADQEMGRYFCFNVKTSDKKTPDDYFYRNLEKAVAKVDDKPCDVYHDDPIWPHNEKKAPFRDSKIFERWDCGEDLILEKSIWRTVGKSFAVAEDEYREAIWFHPETNSIKSLTYNGINIKADRIVGYYGFNDFSVGKCKSSEISFNVVVNGETRYGDTFTPTPGWVEFSIPVDATLEDVEFQVTTTRATWNHFFFNAYIVRNEE